MTRLGGKPSVWLKILVGLALLVAAVALALFLYIRGLGGPAGGEAFTLEVKQGDTLSQVATELQHHHIIKNSQMLRYVMKQNGTAGNLKEGMYDLTGSMTVNEVAAKLAGPARIPVVNVTIPEGRRIKDLPAIFSKAGFDGQAVLKVLNDASLSPYAKSKQPNLEGFVFPATYEFRPSEKPLTVVKTLLDRMNDEFTPTNIAKAKALGLEVRDWVILASMVQAEAASNNDMPVIAGVFINRIRQGISLGSDPTVAYGLGKDLPELDRSAGDFTKDTPYSTYTRKGLPAGPINNPGHAALLSVLSPKLKMTDGRDALYFLHVSSGKIYVNHTYAEHLRDNARYR